MSKISNYLPLLSHLFANPSEKSDRGLLSKRIAIVCIAVIGLSIAARKSIRQISIPRALALAGAILFADILLTFRKTRDRPRQPVPLPHRQDITNPTSTSGTASSSAQAGAPHSSHNSLNPHEDGRNESSSKVVSPQPSPLTNAQDTTTPSASFDSTSSSSYAPSPPSIHITLYSDEIEFIKSLRDWGQLTPAQIFSELTLVQNEHVMRFNIAETRIQIDSFVDIPIIATTKVDIRADTPSQVREFNGNHVQLLEGHRFIATQCPVYEDRRYHTKEHSFLAAIHYNQVCGVVNLMPASDFTMYALEPYVTSNPGETREVAIGPENRTYQMTCLEKEEERVGCSISYHRLSVKDEPDPIPRDLDYIQVSDWPDHKGIKLTHLHQLVSQIRSIRKENPTGGPIIVHCRGGVGRTGTMIVADAIYELFVQKQLNKENMNTIIATLVWTARLQRGPMTVQTPAQMNVLFDYADALLVGKFY